MKPTIFLLLVLLSGNRSFAQKTAADPKYQLISGTNYVQSKNYYLLTLFNEIPAVRQIIVTDPQLVKLKTEKKNQLSQALINCGRDLNCYLSAIKFSDAEIARVSNRLTTLYKTDQALAVLVQSHLLPSGCYSKYADLDGAKLLVKAWEQDAKSINYTIGVYAGGNPPNSPKIDSISFNVKRGAYADLVALNAKVVDAETKNEEMWYAPALTFALHSLEINERNQAADAEPMAETVNKLALDYAKKIEWNKYKYTLILVPGEGPEEKDVSLSAGGMLRCRLAAIQYEKGIAPFIMVSGGAVHPYKTKFNEAIEMKKYLVETLHIPASAILLEPHARHTTTNLRNCARLIFRSGFPMDKPCITSTAKSQSYYITGTMAERCIAELGYLPYKNGKRLSDTEAEFYPLAISLQIDFDEPMDP